MSRATAFMNRIFVADPKERASFADLAKDPWLTAETLGVEELRAELSRRKAAVQEQKRLEREAEEAKRAAASASAAFDPFARDVTRAVGDEEEAGEPAPLLPDTVAQHYTCFYSRAPASALRERLEQAFSSMSAKYKTDEAKYKVKALVNTTTGQQVGLAARVYRHPAGVHVVDVSRRAGDSLKFQEVYNVLCDLVGDIISAPPAEGEEADESKTGAGEAAGAAADADAVDPAAAALAAAEAAVAAATAAAGGAVAAAAPAAPAPSAGLDLI